MSPPLLSEVRPIDPVVVAARGAHVSFDDLLQDPLTRLVMASDGVTEEEMIRLFTQLQRCLAARQRETRLLQSAAQLEIGQA